VRVGILELQNDVTPAGWVVDSIHDLGVDVGSVIPDGFDAYARLFHPAARFEAGAEVPVPWAKIAAVRDRTFHAEMQWPNVSGVWEHSGETAPGLWDREPEVGTMPRAYAARLSVMLAEFTSTPDRVWFGVWDGWGGLMIHPTGRALLTSARSRRRRRSRPQPAPAPRVQLPGRAYYLLHGPISGVNESMEVPPSWQSANLWWPEDRSWCVATEIDFGWTYAGGTRACIETIIEDPELEAMAARIDQGITYAADRINPPPAARP
jgi:hypothetical protein